jgi:hypothetical protein
MIMSVRGLTCCIKQSRGRHILNAGSGGHSPRGLGYQCCASRLAAAGPCDDIKDKCPELRSCQVVTYLLGGGVLGPLPEVATASCDVERQACNGGTVT